MMYAIAKVEPVSMSQVRKTPERRTMEMLEVGEGFYITSTQAMERVRNIRNELRPKKFSVRKLGPAGWQVRREE